jgi:hypothetical protein
VAALHPSPSRISAAPHEGERVSQFDEIAALLERQRQFLMNGDADGLSALSEQLAHQLALAAERRFSRDSLASLEQLLTLSNQSRINMEMLRRREISIQESLEALTLNDGRLGNQRSARVYASAGTLSRATISGRAFASA